MAGRKLRGPHFVVGTGGVAVLPDIGDVERMRDHSGADFFSEEAVKQVFIERQRALGKNRVAELLEFLHDFVIQTGSWW